LVAFWSQELVNLRDVMSNNSNVFSQVSGHFVVKPQVTDTARNESSVQAGSPPLSP
jgi:hypothetical protein